MKIIKDSNNQQWEVYTLKIWSFLFVVPLLYDLIISLLQAQSSHLQGLWQFPTSVMTIGIVAFLAVNADYIYAIRIKVYPSPFSNKTSTIKRTPLQIWIKK